MEENWDSEGESSEGGPLRLEVSYEDWDPQRAGFKSRTTATSNRPNPSAAKRKPRPLAPGGETLACCDMTPDPVTKDDLTVLRPARTYERRRTPRLPPAPVKPQLESSTGDSHGHLENPGTAVHGPREQIMHHQSIFQVRAHTERAGTTGLILRAPGPQSQSWSPDLNCQMARLEQVAETGNAGALLLLEQIRAYGKPRHHFSKRMLVTCARWRKRYCLAYSHARKTQLFTLPSATTLNKRCLPRPISTMGPDSTSNVLFDIRPYRYKSGQRFQTKLSMW